MTRSDVGEHEGVAMIVICAGMYRAASTWQYEVVADLIERHRGGSRLGYMTGVEFAAWERRGGAASSGWWVLKSHEGHPRFAAALRAGRARAVTSWRDPREVVESLLHKRRLDFDTMARRGMIHQVLANDRFWRRPGVLGQSYEDVTAHPIAAIREVAGFLGIEPAQSEAETLAAEYAPEANRARAEALARRLIERGVPLDDPANAQWHDPRSLLHWNHLRSGDSPGWSTARGAADRVVLGRVFGRWLIRHGFEADEQWTDAGSLDWRTRLACEWTLARGLASCRLRACSERSPRLAAWVKAALGWGGPGIGARAIEEVTVGRERVGEAA